MNDEQEYLTRAEIDDLITSRGVSPKTRRTVVWVLGIVALACIGAEITLGMIGETSADAALSTIAATAVGAIGGMAVPTKDV